MFLLVRGRFLFLLEIQQLCMHLFLFLLSHYAGHKSHSQLFTHFIDTFLLFVVTYDHFFIELLEEITKFGTQSAISIQFLTDHHWDLQLDAWNAQYNGLFSHGMNSSTPVAMQVRIGIVFALKFTKSEPFKDVWGILEELFNFFNQRISLPVSPDAFNSNIDLAIALAVHFTMNVNMKQRQINIFECPVMQSLMEWTKLKVLSQQVVRIQIFLIYNIAHSPAQERTVPYTPGKITSQKRRINFSLMNSNGLLKVLASPIKQLRMRRSYKNSTFHHISNILIPKMILSNLLLHHFYINL